MDIGVVFPSTDIGTDIAMVRDFAQTAEALGYSHLLLPDHVLGAVHEGGSRRFPAPMTRKPNFTSR